MPLLLKDIQWSEPLLPVRSDPEWEAEITRRGGMVFTTDRMISPSPWLREAAFGATSYKPSELSDRLHRIGNLVTAQENACRYCYGANRAYLKVLGYSESFIQGIELDVQLAELNDKDRAFIAFCRNLARSRPRPPRASIDKLIGLGYSPKQVTEMAFLISIGCFFNRLSTFIACPPEHKFERMANGPIGRMIGMINPVMRALGIGKQSGQMTETVDSGALTAGRFGPVLTLLAGTSSAKIMKAALDGAFDSQVLSRTTKSLMFAVIARTLGCPHCEQEMTRLLLADGMRAEEIESALSTLRSDRMPPHESGLLSWARDTVYYETRAIQQKTRALTGTIGESALLEAIGVASLANATVRLAMLLE